MPENNYNMINPVDGLNSLAAVNPTDRRKERQKKQYFGKKKNKDQIPQDNPNVKEDEFEDEEILDEHRVDFKA